MRDAGKELKRALQTLRPDAEISDIVTRPWNGSIFNGERHVFEITLRGSDAPAQARWLATVEQNVEAIELRGHKLIDLQINTAALAEFPAGREHLNSAILSVIAATVEDCFEQAA